MKILSLLLVSLLLAPSVLPWAHAQAPGASSADDTWPKQFVSGGNTFSIYQPQIERWQWNELQARAAVGLETAASPQPRFGVIWFSALTNVDKESRMVTLQDMSLFKIDFPGTPDEGIDYASALNDALPSQPIQIALDRLQANLEVNTQFARTQNTALARQGNNVYATHDGNVYRNTGGGWEHYNSSTNSWNRVNTSPAEQRAQQAQREYQSSIWAQQARSQYLAGAGGWQEPARGVGGGWQQHAGELNDSAWSRSAGQERYSSFGSGGGFGDRFGGFRR